MTLGRSEESSLKNVSRRKLLQMGACGAMSSSTFLSTLVHLKLTSAVVASNATVQPTGGYKALVCLYLDGGIDSYNLLTPFGTSQADASYAEYSLTRGFAAMKRSVEWDGALSGDFGYLHPILDSAAAGGTGRTFGLHPRLPYVKQIYDAGHFTFVANAGALVEPIANLGDFYVTSRRKPIGLYSHADQSQHWQTAIPTSRGQLTGWAGRMADLLTDPSTSATLNNVYAAISASGQSSLLTGNRISTYAISPMGSVALAGLGSDNPIDRVYSAVQADLASQTYSDLIEKTVRNSRVLSRDAANAFQSAFSNVTLPSSGVPFPSSLLGQRFAAVARSIKVAQSPAAPLHQERQVFMIQSSGWDHHANLLSGMNDGVSDLNLCLKAFYDFLVAENLLSRVTTFSISDFGRTFSFNGAGTDHGWGGNPFVMGGAVNGMPGNNRIWGTYPSIVMTENNDAGIDLGRGVVIPSTSTDVYHAELCRWFGIGNDANLELVLPNIRNFFSAGQSAHPVGFLQF
jgi:uncharacterized protein (DUF1501 family)